VHTLPACGTTRTVREHSSSEGSLEDQHRGVTTPLALPFTHPSWLAGLATIGTYFFLCILHDGFRPSGSFTGGCFVISAPWSSYGTMGSQPFLNASGCHAVSLHSCLMGTQGAR
jgi:hypothetical protein